MLRSWFDRKRNRPVVHHGGWPRRLTMAVAALMVAFLIVPLLGLVWRALSLRGAAVPADFAILAAVGLSLGTTAVSMLLIVLLGTPLAYVLARYSFPLKRLITIFVELPIVMPPVVAGLALLAAFGRRGLLGSVLAELGITITFSFTAVVLAQVFVAAPFYIRAAQSRFEALPRDVTDAAAVDGADSWRFFWYITLPLSRRALLAGLLLSWARALGEFGATILFAGNLSGRTQTMPLLVYSALEQDLRATFVTALLLLGLAMTAFAVTRWLAGLDGKDADPLAG